MSGSAAESGDGGSRLWKFLSSLRSEHSRGAFTCPDRLLGGEPDPGERICQCQRKSRRQHIDIQLKIALAICSVNDHGTAIMTVRSHQVQRQAPGVGHLDCELTAGLPPTKRIPLAARSSILPMRQFHIILEGALQTQLKCVEVIAAKCRCQDSAQLIAILRLGKLFDGAPNRKIVDEDLALFDRTLRHPAQFSEFNIAKMLNAHPNARP
jgi:hypothetical protein